MAFRCRGTGYGARRLDRPSLVDMFGLHALVASMWRAEALETKAPVLMEPGPVGADLGQWRSLDQADAS